MSKRAEGKAGSGSQKRKGTAKAKESRKAKGKAKAKGGRTGATHKAREQAAGLVDPSVGVVAKDPLRVQILAIAIQQPISPSEFAKESDCPLGTASYHFKVLREHGFLELVEEVKVRGTLKHMHRATKSGFISDRDWGEVAQALRPGVAGAILQDFNGRVTQAMEAGTFYARDDACMFWVPITLDENTWSKFIEMLAWAIKEAKEFEVETVKLRANGEADGCIPVTFAIAGFESPTAEEVKAKAKRKRKPAKGKGKGEGKGKPGSGKA
jgi:DNA-binding transcriptional ArsR family regulator